eukprot:GHVS01096924.1.p1 GENE.GHVS01096924.1~~GHVS01096924.1.p1  ORF type:complete len:434 (+),score=66.38 GHVS01096924.1:1916-3217(+)
MLPRLQADVRTLQTTLKNSEEERNRLQKQLDEREEEQDVVRNHLREKEVELITLRRGLEELCQQAQGERELHQESLKTEREQVEKLREAMSAANVELQQAQSVSRQALEDMGHVCRENRMFKETINRCQQINAEQDNQVKEGNLQLHNATEEICRIQAQRDNAIVAHNKLVDEKQQADELLRSQATSLSKLQGEHHALLQRVSDFSQQLITSRKAHQVVLNDYVALRNQMTQIAGAMEQQSESAVQQEMKAQQQNHDIHIAQATCQQMELARLQFQRDLNTLDSEKGILQSKLEKAKSDLEEKTKVLLEANSREAQLERIISDQRMHVLQLEQTVHTMNTVSVETRPRVDVRDAAQTGQKPPRRSSHSERLVARRTGIATSGREAARDEQRSEHRGSSVSAVRRGVEPVEKDGSLGDSSHSGGPVETQPRKTC